jgi:hypothetical protein
MSHSERIDGPAGSKRPFVPTGGHDDPMKDVAGALDHIARAISAIDHNLEVLITRIGTDSSAAAVVAASLDEKSK